MLSCKIIKKWYFYLNLPIKILHNRRARKIVWGVLTFLHLGMMAGHYEMIYFSSEMEEMEHSKRIYRTLRAPLLSLLDHVIDDKIEFLETILYAIGSILNSMVWAAGGTTLVLIILSVYKKILQMSNGDIKENFSEQGHANLEEGGDNHWFAKKGSKNWRFYKKIPEIVFRNAKKLKIVYGILTFVYFSKMILYFVASLTDIPNVKDAPNPEIIEKNLEQVGEWRETYRSLRFPVLPVLDRLRGEEASSYDPILYTIGFILNSLIRSGVYMIFIICSLVVFEKVFLMISKKRG